mmetsp:Transcript_54895/g.81677  ORF Transcript_54895/g.81677 Transcript_54895/m.81677 type:complete len:300 (-) Transcript_54895:149-1048(-)
MVPLKAACIFTQGIEMFFLECSGAARLVLVSPVQIESVKVVGAAKVGIHKNFPQNCLVKFHRVKFGSDLVWRNSSERSNKGREETTHVPGCSFNDDVVGLHILVRETLFCPLLKVESDRIHDEGDEKFGEEASRSRGDKSLTEDAFDPPIPPLAPSCRHGVSHSLPNVKGNRDVGGSPDAPPFLVCEFWVPKHADFKFKEPQLVLVHVTDDDFGGSFNGVIKNDVSGRTNTEDDVIRSDFQDLVVDGWVLPANVVDVGSVANGINHIEGFFYNGTSHVQNKNSSRSIGSLRIGVESKRL